MTRHPICPTCRHELLRYEGVLSCYQCGWRYELEPWVIAAVADGFQTLLADGYRDPLTPLYNRAVVESSVGYNSPDLELAASDGGTHIFRPLELIACCDWHEAMIEREELACEIANEMAVA